jgi:hypothetical protein
MDWDEHGEEEVVAHETCELIRNSAVMIGLGEFLTGFIGFTGLKTGRSF